MIGENSLNEPEALAFCPVCGSPGEPASWRGLNLLYRCRHCGQHFIDDGLGSLEADLSREVG